MNIEFVLMNFSSSDRIGQNSKTKKEKVAKILSHVFTHLTGEQPVTDQVQSSQVSSSVQINSEKSDEAADCLKH